MTMYANGTYLARNPDWHSEDSEWKAAHLWSVLDSQTRAEMKRRVVRVVEVGCGYGGVLAGFCARQRAHGVTCIATGYDISPHAVSEAARQHPDIQFLCQDFLKTAENYYVGLLVDLLEHLDDPALFLRCSRRRFRLLLVHLPLDENWYGKALYPGRYYEYLREDRGHIHYFTKAMAFRLLASAGLRLARWKYTPWGLERYESGGGRSAPVVRMLRSVGMSVCPDLTVRVLGGASLACLCHTGWPAR